MNKSLNYMTPFSYAKLHTILVIAGSTAVAAIDVGIRKRTGDLIDLLGEGRISDFAFLTFVLMLCTYVVVSFILPYIKTRLSDHIQETLYLRLHQKALTAKQEALDKIDAGAVGTYFTSDTANIVRYVNRITGIAIPDIFSFLISSVALMKISPCIGSTAIISAVIPVAVMYCMSRFLVRGNMAYQQILQQINGHITRHFFNLEFVKASQMEEALECENTQLLKQLLGGRKKIAKNEAFLSFPMMLASFITILIVALLGGFLVSEGEISIGELFTAIALVDFIVDPVMRFENTMKQIRRAEANIARLNQYFAMPDADNSAPQITVRNGNANALEINDLKFVYPDAKQVFDGVDFLWEQGRLNVLVGENGTGKTTLIKILTGIYGAQGGTISVIRRDSKRPGNMLLSDDMAVDTQKTILFADTIYNNLTLGQDMSMEKVRSACCAVGLDDEITSMSDGYDTQLGADGKPLSGGQKRRLCVARTLLRESDIYIFDEPTAGVDSANMGVMIDALQRLAREKLVIIITHEQRLITAADTITRLEAIT